MDTVALVSHQPIVGLLPRVFDDVSDLADLPTETETWPLHVPHSGTPCPDSPIRIADCLARVDAHGGWHWPSKPVVFLSDTHADAEGFRRSLVAAGVIRRRPGRANDFDLTHFGREATILIGGDCLDKGPSNLDMLDALAALMAKGPDLHILAGNHDLRLHLAISALMMPRNPLTDHLFVRMGRKLIPLLREVYDRYVTAADMAAMPDTATCRARLLPGDDWAKQFKQAAKGYLAPDAIKKEVKNLRKKHKQLGQAVDQAQMCERMLLAAAQRCHDVFFTPTGPYAWFYDHMDVVRQFGSLLFVHAGLDDSMCALLEQGGADAVNARYRAGAGDDPFGFYFGPLANLVRTKYRKTDKHLSETGVRTLHRVGVHMVVQGHVNNHAGQRLLEKQGLLHLEGDVTLDRASRQREGLSGIGAGATLIFPTGDIVGISRDYPRAKHFAPERHTQRYR